MFLIIQEKCTLSESGVGGKARLRSGKEDVLILSQFFLLPGGSAFLVCFIQFSIMLPVDKYVANLLVNEFVAGFLASCRVLVDAYLIFGPDPGSSAKGGGSCSSSTIPLSAISLYRYSLLSSISCTAMMDGLFASSIEAESCVTPLIGFLRDAARRFWVKKATTRRLSTRIANVPTPTPISKARFLWCEIATVEEDRAGMETISLSRPSSNFVWKIEKLEYS